MVHNKLITIVVLALLASFSFATQTRDLLSKSDQLWSKYRVSLVKILEAMAKKKGLPVRDNALLQILVDPQDARWDKSRYYLNEDFLKFPPKFSPEWEYVATTDDYSMANLYRTAMVKTGNPQLFIQFKRAKTESFPKEANSYPWYEKGVTLASFVARNRKNQNRKPLHFIVEEKSGQTSISSPWGKSFGPKVTTASFVRSIEQDSNDDDDLLATTSDDDTLATTDEDQFLFRRRRRRSPPPKVVTIHVKSQKFKVDFKCEDYDGIKVQPGDWFNRAAFVANRGKYKDYFGKKGKFPLLPSTIWVVYRPKVVLELSESEYNIYKHVWNKKSTLGMMIGGAFFRTKHFAVKARDDDDVASLGLSDDDIAFYRNETLAEFHADDAEFSVEDVEAPVADDSQIDVPVVEDEPADNEAGDLLMDNTPQGAEEDQWFFRRRRRRRRYVPPPKPRKVYERVYKATFSSKSVHPQILAVTSDRLDV